MRYQHVAGLVFDQPLMIEPGKARLIAEYLAARIRSGAGVPHLRVGEVRPARRESLQVESGIALIDVSGILVNRAGQMDGDSNPLLSYEQITSEIEAAVEDGSVRGILMRVDSPGGEVAGVFDLAQRIREIEKPVWAIAAAQASSAAYLLGSAARRFVVSQEATTGSIGVVLARLDLTKALDADGVRMIQIAAGARKLDGSPFQPWEPGSDEEKALRAYVGRTYDLFVGAVAGYRRISEGAVRQTDAGLFVGQGAVDAKLADAVGTIRDTLKQLAETTNAQARSLIMEQPAAQPTKLTPEQVRAQYPDVIAAERKEAADQERARILGIEALDGPKELLQKCKADASCTVEQAALRVNEAQKASRAAHMDALRQDERQLDPPAPLAEEGEESSASAEATRVLQLHQRLRGRAPAGANC